MVWKFVLQKLKRRILVQCEQLILLCVCSSVKHASYVHAINIFLRFLTEESEISIKKDFGHVLATGYWQIPLIFHISVAVHTHRLQKVKKPDS